MEADWLGRQLEQIHGYLRAYFPGVERLAVALYEPKTDKLKTFVHSSASESPLVHYEAVLADVPSLAELADSGRSRVIDDLQVFAAPTQHTRRLLEAGYQSSYTIPVHADGGLFGFLFFDSKEPQYFAPLVVERLAVFGHLLALSLVHSVTPIRMLHSALRVASRLTHYRDPETGAHLDRMSHFARLIGRELAPQHNLSDEFIEFLFLFAPIHDVGKIAVPDHILLKRGRLLEEEFDVMKTHVTKGAEIVDGIVRDLGLAAFPHIETLRNVVLFHHEAIDGSGYPRGLSGSGIPVEARIVTVADVFDALTSERPYKAAWSREAALSYLSDGVGTKFDGECVSVLLARLREIEEIRLRFRDEAGPGFQSREGYSLDL